MGISTDLRKHLISLYHDSGLRGHSRVNTTYHRLRKHFNWPGMQLEVLRWVTQCDQCARCKGEHCALPGSGLLQPLPVLSQAWQHISMDFIEQLPKANDKDTILVVVCRFSKYRHFLPSADPFSAITVAKNLLDHGYYPPMLPAIPADGLTGGHYKSSSIAYNR